VESGIAIRIPIPPKVHRLRRHYDDGASLGVPPHLTVLYPFLPTDRLEPRVRDQLARIAREHEPFEVELTAVGRWPRVVYLVAEPADRLVALTNVVAECWPDFLPYGGAHAELVPHVTICESDDPLRLDAVERELDGIGLPIRARAERLEVLTEGEDGRWRPHWRIRLGSG
jgi:2'-5' RNA ligase